MWSKKAKATAKYFSWSSFEEKNLVTLADPGIIRGGGGGVRAGLFRYLDPHFQTSLQLSDYHYTSFLIWGVKTKFSLNPSLNGDPKPRLKYRHWLCNGMGRGKMQLLQPDRHCFLVYKWVQSSHYLRCTSGTHWPLLKKIKLIQCKPTAFFNLWSWSCLCVWHGTACTTFEYSKTSIANCCESFFTYSVFFAGRPTQHDKQAISWTLDVCFIWVCTLKFIQKQ